MPAVCQRLWEAGDDGGDKDSQSATHAVSCSSGGSREKQTITVIATSENPIEEIVGGEGAVSQGLTSGQGLSLQEVTLERRPEGRASQLGRSGGGAGSSQDRECGRPAKPVSRSGWCKRNRKESGGGRKRLRNLLRAY